VRKQQKGLTDGSRKEPETKGVPQTSDSRLKTFLDLSSVLTGHKVLPIDLGTAYFERAQQSLGNKLDALLDRYSQLIGNSGHVPIDTIRTEVVSNPDLGPPAKTVLLLWYIGGIQNAAGDWEMQSADQYYRALVWETIGAHPPTLSNGYFGHWKYPAER
jgi:hypothetical protein